MAITQQQKNQNVIEAGRGAYRMNIAISGNPHSNKQQYRDLWDKGWRLERKKEDTCRPQGKRPPFRKEGEPGTRKHPHPRKVERKLAPRVQAVKDRLYPQSVEDKSVVITDRMVNRFNRRHQTAQ